jgi:transposase
LKPDTIAEVFDVARKIVYNWKKWWREDGFDGLLDGHPLCHPLAGLSQGVK